MGGAITETAKANAANLAKANQEAAAKQNAQLSAGVSSQIHAGAGNKVTTDSAGRTIITSENGGDVVAGGQSKESIERQIALHRDNPSVRPDILLIDKPVSPIGSQSSVDKINKGAILATPPPEQKNKQITPTTPNPKGNTGTGFGNGRITFDSKGNTLLDGKIVSFAGRQAQEDFFAKQGLGNNGKIVNEAKFAFADFRPIASFNLSGVAGDKNNPEPAAFVGPAQVKFETSNIAYNLLQRASKTNEPPPPTPLSSAELISLGNSGNAGDNKLASDSLVRGSAAEDIAKINAATKASKFSPDQSNKDYLTGGKPLGLTVDWHPPIGNQYKNMGQAINGPERPRGSQAQIDLLSSEADRAATRASVSAGYKNNYNSEFDHLTAPQEQGGVITATSLRIGSRGWDLIAPNSISRGGYAGQKRSESDALLSEATRATRFYDVRKDENADYLTGGGGGASRTTTGILPKNFAIESGPKTPQSIIGPPSGPSKSVKTTLSLNEGLGLSDSVKSDKILGTVNPSSGNKTINTLEIGEGLGLSDSLSVTKNGKPVITDQQQTFEDYIDKYSKEGATINVFSDNRLVGSVSGPNAYKDILNINNQYPSLEAKVDYSTTLEGKALLKEAQSGAVITIQNAGSKPDTLGSSLGILNKSNASGKTLNDIVGKAGTNGFVVSNVLYPEQEKAILSSIRSNPAFFERLSQTAPSYYKQLFSSGKLQPNDIYDIEGIFHAYDRTQTKQQEPIIAANAKAISDVVKRNDPSYYFAFRDENNNLISATTPKTERIGPNGKVETIGGNKVGPYTTGERSFYDFMRVSENKPTTSIETHFSNKGPYVGEILGFEKSLSALQNKTYTPPPNFQRMNKTKNEIPFYPTTLSTPTPEAGQIPSGVNKAESRPNERISDMIDSLLSGGKTSIQYSKPNTEKTFVEGLANSIISPAGLSLAQGESIISRIPSSSKPTPEAGQIPSGLTISAGRPQENVNGIISSLLVGGKTNVKFSKDVNTSQAGLDLWHSVVPIRTYLYSDTKTLLGNAAKRVSDVNYFVVNSRVQNSTYEEPKFSINDLHAADQVKLTPEAEKIANATSSPSYFGLVMGKEAPAKGYTGSYYLGNLMGSAAPLLFGGEEVVLKAGSIGRTITSPIGSAIKTGVARKATSVILDTNVRSDLTSGITSSIANKKPSGLAATFNKKISQPVVNAFQKTADLAKENIEVKAFTPTETGLAKKNIPLPNPSKEQISKGETNLANKNMFRTKPDVPEGITPLEETPQVQGPRAYGFTVNPAPDSTIFTPRATVKEPVFTRIPKTAKNAGKLTFGTANPLGENVVIAEGVAPVSTPEPILQTPTTNIIEEQRGIVPAAAGNISSEYFEKTIPNKNNLRYTSRGELTSNVYNVGGIGIFRETEPLITRESNTPFLKRGKFGKASNQLVFGNNNQIAAAGVAPVRGILQVNLPALTKSPISRPIAKQDILAGAKSRSVNRRSSGQARTATSSQTPIRVFATREGEIPAVGRYDVVNPSFGSENLANRPPVFETTRVNPDETRLSSGAAIRSKDLSRVYFPESGVVVGRGLPPVGGVVGRITFERELPTRVVQNYNEIPNQRVSGNFARGGNKRPTTSSGTPIRGFGTREGELPPVGRYDVLQKSTGADNLGNVPYSVTSDSLSSSSPPLFAKTNDLSGVYRVQGGGVVASGLAPVGGILGRIKFDYELPPRVIQNYNELKTTNVKYSEARSTPQTGTAPFRPSYTKGEVRTGGRLDYLFQKPSGKAGTVVKPMKSVTSKRSEPVQENPFYSNKQISNMKKLSSVTRKPKEPEHLVNFEFGLGRIRKGVRVKVGLGKKEPYVTKNKAKYDYQKVLEEGVTRPDEKFGEVRNTLVSNRDKAFGKDRIRNIIERNQTFNQTGKAVKEYRVINDTISGKAFKPKFVNDVTGRLEEGTLGLETGGYPSNYFPANKNIKIRPDLSEVMNIGSQLEKPETVKPQPEPPRERERQGNPEIFPSDTFGRFYTPEPPSKPREVVRSASRSRLALVSAGGTLLTTRPSISQQYKPMNDSLLSQNVGTAQGTRNGSRFRESIKQSPKERQRQNQPQIFKEQQDIDQGQKGAVGSKQSSRSDSTQALKFQQVNVSGQRSTSVQKFKPLEDLKFKQDQITQKKRVIVLPPLGADKRRRKKNSRVENPTQTFLRSVNNPFSQSLSLRGSTIIPTSSRRSRGGPTRTYTKNTPNIFANSLSIRGTKSIWK